MVPVFVVSSGRVGSMMVARLLEGLPGVAAHHEPRPFLLDLNYRAWRGTLDPEEALRALHARRDAMIEDARRKDLVYFESSHQLTFLVPAIAQAFRPRFVHLIRDGRPFVRSGLARGWFILPKPARLGMLAVARASTAVGYPVWEYEMHRLWPPRSARSRVARVSWLWAQYNLAIDRGMRESGAESIRMRLEDFETAPEAAIDRLLTFVGLAPGDRLPELAERCRARPNKTERPLDERWTDEDEADYQRWAGPAARYFGYGG
jgi:hypothetical protein